MAKLFLMTEVIQLFNECITNFKPTVFIEKFNDHFLGQFLFFLKFGKPVWSTSLVFQTKPNKYGDLVLILQPLLSRVKGVTIPSE